jgi:UDP-glucose 4-epimerase
VDLNGRNPNLEKSVRLNYGDIRDVQLMKRMLVGVDAVVHAAALSGVRGSMDNSSSYISNNVIGTSRLLESLLCMPNKSKIKFIFLSTAGALFGPSTKEIDIDSAPNPMSVYGATKVAGEALCSAYAASEGVRTVSLRLTNVFGPLCDSKETVIANWAKAVTTNSGEPMIYGDGRHSRDFVHVTDVIQMIKRCLLSNYKPGSKYIVGSGRQRTIRQMADIFASAARKSGYFDVPMRRVNFDGVEAESCNVNISASVQDLGYAPKVVSDEQVELKISEIIEWFYERALEEEQIQNQTSSIGE